MPRSRCHCRKAAVSPLPSRRCRWSEASATAQSPARRALSSTSVSGAGAAEPGAGSGKKRGAAKSGGANAGGGKAGGGKAGGGKAGAAASRSGGARRADTDSTPRRSNGRLAREVSKIESRIAGIEADIAAVEAEVAEAGAAGDVDAITRLGERHRALQEDLSYAMAEWEDRAAMLVEGS